MAAAHGIMACMAYGGENKRNESGMAA